MCIFLRRLFSHLPLNRFASALCRALDDLLIPFVLRPRRGAARLPAGARGILAATGPRTPGRPGCLPTRRSSSSTRDATSRPRRGDRGADGNGASSGAGRRRAGAAAGVWRIANTGVGCLWAFGARVSVASGSPCGGGMEPAGCRRAEEVPTGVARRGARPVGTMCGFGATLSVQKKWAERAAASAAEAALGGSGVPCDTVGGAGPTGVRRSPHGTRARAEPGRARAHRVCGVRLSCRVGHAHDGDGSGDSSAATTCSRLGRVDSLGGESKCDGERRFL